jgi:hypothetical protein
MLEEDDCSTSSPNDNDDSIAGDDADNMDQVLMEKFALFALKKNHHLMGMYL